jgi:hypothetical protein
MPFSHCFPYLLQSCNVTQTLPMRTSELQTKGCKHPESRRAIPQALHHSTIRTYPLKRPMASCQYKPVIQRQRVIAPSSEDQGVVHISVLETATNNSGPGLSPTVRDVTTFPSSFPSTQDHKRRHPRSGSVFRPADHGLVAWTQPDRDVPNASSGHGIEEPSDIKSKKSDQKNHNSKAFSDLVKAYVGDKMKFSGDSYEESLLTAHRRFFTICICWT